MKARCVIIIVAVAASASLPLSAVDGTILAQSDASPAFEVYTVSDATYAMMSQEDIAALPSVFRRVEDTVTVTSPYGDVTAFGEMPLSSLLDSGGVWTLSNSGLETARIGIAWSVYGDGGRTLASGGSAECYKVNSMQTGPDRTTKKKDVLPVAYTGDNWIGDVSKASSLSFVSPSGVTNTFNFAGTDATSFKFGDPGCWTVILSMVDGATHKAAVMVNGYIVISFR